MMISDLEHAVRAGELETVNQLLISDDEIYEAHEGCAPLFGLALESGYKTNSPKWSVIQG